MISIHDIFLKRYITGTETKVYLVCTLYSTNLVLLQMCHFQVHHTCYWHITIKLNRYADNGNRRRSGLYTDIHTKSCVEFSKKHDVVYLILRLFQFLKSQIIILKSRSDQCIEMCAVLWNNTHYELKSLLLGLITVGNHP